MSGRVESAQSARERYGSHWVLCRLKGDSFTISEVLGPATGWYGRYESLADAVEAARSLRAEYLKQAEDRAASLLDRPANRLAIALARAGLHPRKAGILKAAAHYQDRLTAARDGLQDDGWTPEIVRLPIHLNLPAPIAIDSSVWEVGYEWPLEHGINLREYRVDGVRIYSGEFQSDGYDAKIVYDCELVSPAGPDTPSMTRSFSYQRDDLWDPAIPDDTIRNSRLFLTKEAALAHATDIARRLADQVRISMERMGLSVPELPSHS